MKVYYHDLTHDPWEAKAMVEHYHYSHRWPAAVQYVFGMRLDGGLLGDCGELVAACVFGHTMGKWKEQVLELFRLVRKTETQPLTGLISWGIKRIKERRKFNLLISYADTGQNHHGGIYQAASWEYDGLREMHPPDLIIDGKIVHSRSSSFRYGTVNPKVLREMGINCTGTHTTRKHLYWKPLNKPGRRKAQRLGLKSLPYPKPQREDRCDA